MPPSTSSPPSHSLACQAVAPILVCGAVALSAEGGEVEDVELGATAAWAEGMAELELLAPGGEDSAALGAEQQQQQQQQQEEEEAGQGPVTTAAAAAAEGGVPAAHGPVACGVCGEAAAKYCCPGCRQRTCSLACSRAHKAASGCSGQRDRLGFVPLAQFNDRHLMSDYRLLEEVARVDDVARRRLPPGARALLPPALQSLVYQAGRRRVNLLLMPPGMHKRRSNSTRYDGAARKLSWRVEWVFKSAGVRLADESVAEDAVLQAVLQRHLDYAPGAASKHFALRKYTDAGLPALKVFMRKEGTPANAPGYYAVDLSRPLGSQLAGKLVVEYPCLLVALPGEESEFPSAFTHHPKPGGEGASAAANCHAPHPSPSRACCISAGAWPTSHPLRMGPSRGGHGPPPRVWVAAPSEAAQTLVVGGPPPPLLVPSRERVETSQPLQEQGGGGVEADWCRDGARPACHCGCLKVRLARQRQWWSELSFTDQGVVNICLGVGPSLREPHHSQFSQGTGDLPNIYPHAISLNVVT
ncbi:hypothetical protein V8C86DRAFT_993519 [Haematococcus lacustris]